MWRDDYISDLLDRICFELQPIRGIRISDEDGDHCIQIDILRASKVDMYELYAYVDGDCLSVCFAEQNNRLNLRYTFCEPPRKEEIYDMATKIIDYCVLYCK